MHFALSRLADEKRRRRLEGLSITSRCLATRCQKQRLGRPDWARRDHLNRVIVTSRRRTWSSARFH